MIKLSVKGLAKFMTSNSTRQRKVLNDYKYPKEDEPNAMRLYYREATGSICAYHKNDHEAEWLVAKAREIAMLAALQGGRSATRLKHNARALRDYAQHFSHRAFTPIGQLRLRQRFGSVEVTVTPDMYAAEKGKPKLVKLEFGKDPLTPDAVRIISQVMFEAAKTQVPDCTSSSVLLLDVRRGEEHRGARAGARTLREIEDACKNIEQLWDGI